MQANHQSGEGKGEPYFAPLENYLPPAYLWVSSELILMWENTFLP